MNTFSESKTCTAKNAENAERNKGDSALSAISAVRFLFSPEGV
jgi:hypothetical protein